MAAGDVITGTSNSKRAIKLIENVIATSAAPSAATDGVPVHQTKLYETADKALSYSQHPAAEATLVIDVVGSAGTVTGMFRLWGYQECTGKWYPMGTGADADKGKVNEGTELGEVASNVVLHAEPVLYVGHFDRIYLQCTAIGGTDATANAWLVTPCTVSY